MQNQMSGSRIETTNVGQQRCPADFPVWAHPDTKRFSPQNGAMLLASEDRFDAENGCDLNAKK